MATTTTIADGAAQVLPPNVAYKHPQYDDIKLLWQMIRDCISGERAVKSRGETYLPHPDPDSKAKDATKAKTRYTTYQTRAQYFNATGRTLNGLVGQVFSRESVVELPSRLEPLVGNIDGNGVSLEQMSKVALSDTLGLGRAGLLADYPARTAPDGTVLPTTVADLEQANVRPRLMLYQPEAVINWREGSFGALTLLTLVVLAEEDTQYDQGGFELVRQPQYRVLRLSPERVYTAEVWRQVQGAQRFEMVEQYTPRNAAGTNFTEIPFTFIGPDDNSPSVSIPPLGDIAVLNIGHYRNSADYEESVFMTGQPTLLLKGLTKDWVRDVLGGQVRFGALGAIPLPEGADGNLVQAAPNQLAKEAMEHKEKLMKALGAKLVDEQKTQRTATEATMDETASTSVLGSTAKNVGEAITKGLRWMADFIGEDPAKVVFELNTDFDIARLSPQERAQLIAEYQGGLLTWEETRWNMKRAGIAYEDDTKAKTEIDREKQETMNALGVLPTMGRAGTQKQDQQPPTEE
jgi:hypothetical protein